MVKENYKAIICPNCGKAFFLQEGKCNNCGYDLTEKDKTEPIIDDEVYLSGKLHRDIQMGRNRYKKD